MAKGVFHKVDDRTLVAIGLPAMEALGAIKRDVDCMCDVRGARNIEQFNLFWALCHLVAKATDTTKESVKEWVMKKLNLVDLLWLPDGLIEIRAKSIKFESMEQAPFAEMMTAAIPHIADLLGAAPQDVIDRFNDMLDPNARAHFKKVLRYVHAPSVAADAPVIEPAPDRADERALAEVGRGRGEVS